MKFLSYLVTAGNRAERDARVALVAANMFMVFALGLYACGDDDDSDGTGDDTAGAVACTADGDCADGKKCLDGQCVECIADTDCTDAAKPVCNTETKVCEAAGAGTDDDDNDGINCESDEDCDASRRERCLGRICAQVECLADTDCADGKVCDEPKNVCRAAPTCQPSSGDCACENNFDCSAQEGYVCNGLSKKCELADKCTSNADCSGATPICNTATGLCEGNTTGACENDLECQGGRKCRTSDGVCVECLDNNDCSALQFCNTQTGGCESTATCGDSPCCPLCGTGEWCNELAAGGPECAAVWQPEDGKCPDADCPSPAVCVKKDDDSLECQAAPACDPACGANEVCEWNYANFNKPECKPVEPGTCDSGIRVPEVVGLCAPCESDADCGAGTVCWTNGRAGSIPIIDPGVPAGACPAPGGGGGFPGLGGETFCFCAVKCECDEQCPAVPPSSAWQFNPHADDDDDATTTGGDTGVPGGAATDTGAETDAATAGGTDGGDSGDTDTGDTDTGDTDTGDTDTGTPVQTCIAGEWPAIGCLAGVGGCSDPAYPVCEGGECCDIAGGGGTGGTGGTGEDPEPAYNGFCKVPAQGGQAVCDCGYPEDASGGTGGTTGFPFPFP